ncbi:energy-coupling factor transporter transmembrane component T family protein [Pseudogemmobacter sonorensis]|uniref:energy-coupling factor transporter transmembrane component T family protein n=1 Tax=Pseudogemmobacter sonorensis TaxID=2989681 RepID=UPI0036C15A35
MLTLTSPVETPFHRVKAGWKLAALCAGTIGLFALQDPRLLAAALAAVAALHLPGGMRFARHALAMLRPIWPFIAVVVLWHLWTGETRSGAAIALRMVTAVAAANLVTMTTRLSDMLAVIERLCRPLSPLIPPRRLALAFALTIRFIPTMAEALGRIRESWSARSPRRPGWRILVPGVLAALDGAEQAAEALRARGGAD